MQEIVVIGKSIKLNNFEQKLCKALAQLRHSSNRESSVKNSKIGPQSNEETDLEGISAEMAFCKLMNLYPDLSISPRSSQAETDKGDVTLKNGKTVDVKTTKYSNGKLLAPLWKKQTGDYFVLMVGSFPEYNFKGFIEQEKVLSPNKVINLGYGPTYHATQSELKMIEGDL